MKKIDLKVEITHDSKGNPVDYKKKIKKLSDKFDGIMAKIRSLLKKND